MSRIPEHVFENSLGLYPYKIVEIGVHKGDHAQEILNVLPVEKLWLVDPWSSKYPMEHVENNEETWNSLFRYVRDRFANRSLVEIVRTTSEEASKFLPNELDFVYIDADHSYESCLQDILYWWPKIKVGGILGGDDYPYPGVQKATDEILHQLLVYKHNSEYKLEISESQTQWWIVKLGQDEIV